MAGESFEDYLWLVSEEGARCLRQIAEDPRGDLELARSLRRDWSASRVRLLLEQRELRRRASEKFTCASQMFFTRKGLEQATDETIALWKSRRFTAGKPVWDLCCGIGGDLLGFATRGDVEGWERDRVTALFAQANAELWSTAGKLRGRAVVTCADVREIETRLEGVELWHLDPDRRPGTHRVSQARWSEPPWEFAERLWTNQPHGAIKLAPAARVCSAWEAQLEWEWIGHRGECRQLIAWGGNLAQQLGMRRASILFRRGLPQALAARTIVGTGKETLLFGERIERFVYDPHPAVLAARLVPALAAELSLRALAPRGGYLTGENLLEDPALSTYEVKEVLPFDVKKLREYLRLRDAGWVEIKKRGVALEPERLRGQLRLRGSNTAWLIIAPFSKRVVALMVEPVFSSSSGDSG